jgi:hypothetical protein
MGQLNFHQRLATIASRAGLHEPIHHAPKINNNNWKKKKKKKKKQKGGSNVCPLSPPITAQTTDTAHRDKRR